MKLYTLAALVLLAVGCGPDPASYVPALTPPPNGIYVEMRGDATLWLDFRDSVESTRCNATNPGPDWGVVGYLDDDPVYHDTGEVEAVFIEAPTSHTFEAYVMGGGQGAIRVWLEGKLVEAHDASPGLVVVIDWPARKVWYSQ